MRVGLLLGNLDPINDTYIVKTPGSQMGSPAAAEEGGELMGGGRWDFSIWWYKFFKQ